MRQQYFIVIFSLILMATIQVILKMVLETLDMKMKTVTRVTSTSTSLKTHSSKTPNLMITGLPPIHHALMRVIPIILSTLIHPSQTWVHCPTAH